MINWNEVIDNPQKGFVDLLQPLAISPIVEALIHFLSKYIQTVRIESVVVKARNTEHENFEKHEAFEAEVLTIEFEREDKKSILRIAHPDINKKKPVADFPYDHFGFIQTGWGDNPDTVLFGQNNFSIWESDEWKFEESSKEELDILEGYENCLIELNEHQWILQHKTNGDLVLVSNICTWDRNVCRLEKSHKGGAYFIQQLAKRPAGEYILKLTTAYLCGIHLSLAITDERVYSLILQNGVTSKLSAIDIFSNEIPNYFKVEKNCCEWEDINGSIQFDVIGANSGTWVIDFTAKKDIVKVGQHASVTATIIFSESIFLKAYTGILKKAYKYAESTSGDRRIIIETFSLSIFD